MQISVVIPTYNRYEVLKRALKSVYAQTHMSKEIIVIDDGSTDETSQITEEFPHVRYIYQKNSGVSSARNLGIQNSTCQWIAFLDSDDEWHEDKLSSHVEFHSLNPDMLISYTDEKWIRDNKEVNLPKKYQKYGGDIFSKCLSHCIIAPSATLIHKSLLDSVGLFDESLEVCEDYDLWLRVAHKNQIGLIDKKLITKYGGSDDQLSMKHWGMDRFRVIALEKLLDNSFVLDKQRREEVRETILKKYNLLLKGAIKHKRGLDIKEYEKKILFYNSY